MIYFKSLPTDIPTPFHAGMGPDPDRYAVWKHFQIYSDFVCLILYMSVNNCPVMSGRGFLGWTNTTKQRIKCPAQGHNAVPPLRLEPATPGSWVKHSNTAPLRTSAYLSDDPPRLWRFTTPTLQGSTLTTFDSDVWQFVKSWGTVNKKRKQDLESSTLPLSHCAPQPILEMTPHPPPWLTFPRGSTSSTFDTGVWQFNR